MSGGTPTVTLNDGETASFDPAASNAASGTLVFDYTIGTQAHTADLAQHNVAQLEWVINDANGVALRTSLASRNSRLV